MAEKDIDILCIGNALVDVFTADDHGIARRHGITLPVQHVAIETLQALLAELGAGEPAEADVPETARPEASAVFVSGGAQNPHARHRACSFPESNTACPQENPSPAVFVSGGAQNPHARHRARSFPESNTACPQENPSPAVFVSGGGAANVAKIAGFLGAKVSFTGAVGRGGGTQSDSFGRFFARSLAAAGVELRLPVKDSPTGICLVLKRGEETRIAASPSAALELSERDISEDEIKRARVAVIDGFMLGRAGLARHILRLAETHGTTAAIDLSSPSIAGERAKEIARYAARYPLILFMNEAESAAFNKALGTPEGASALTGPRKGFPIVVVKLGARGAVCFEGESLYRAETRAITARETTGAGDAFSAAFLAAWTRGKSLADCAALGNKIAALVLDAEGSQPDKTRLKDFSW